MFLDGVYLSRPGVALGDLVDQQLLVDRISERLAHAHIVERFSRHVDAIEISGQHRRGDKVIAFPKLRNDGVGNRRGPIELAVHVHVQAGCL